MPRVRHHPAEAERPDFEAMLRSAPARIFADFTFRAVSMASMLIYHGTEMSGEDFDAVDEAFCHAMNGVRAYAYGEIPRNALPALASAIEGSLQYGTRIAERYAGKPCRQ